MSELGDYRRLVEKPAIANYETTIASLRSENERLQDALQQLVDYVKDGCPDDGRYYIMTEAQALLKGISVVATRRNALADKLETRLRRDRHGKIDPELGISIDAGLCKEIFEAVTALRASTLSLQEGGKP
jgi:hypothetical protein